MRCSRTIAAIIMTAILALSLATFAGCDDDEKPLPQVEGITVVQGPPVPDNDVPANSVIVSWTASRDPRVEGYAIYRAEQGIGATATEKSDYSLQAITIATRYVDDEVRVSVRYPVVHYYYQLAAIGPGGITGPMSAEVSIEYSATD